MKDIRPIFYVSSSWFPRHYNWHIQKNIPHNYVIIWCIYNPSIELSKIIWNRQYSMLSFHKKNTPPQKSNLQGTLTTFMLEYLAILNCLGSWCTNEIFSRHYMSDFSLLHSTISSWTFSTLMLELLVIFFRSLPLIGEGKISNNLFLVHPVLYRILIDRYRKYISQIFMLADVVHIPCPLN